MGRPEELALLQEQLTGLATAVEKDDNLPTNMEDYLVTLNSLKKRIAAIKQSPDDLAVGGTMTGRMSTKTPNVATLPRTGIDDAAIKAELLRLHEQETMNPHIHPPKTDRRAAIEHTRRLNELSNGS